MSKIKVKFLCEGDNYPCICMLDRNSTVNSLLELVRVRKKRDDLNIVKIDNGAVLANDSLIAKANSSIFKVEAQNNFLNATTADLDIFSNISIQKMTNGFTKRFELSIDFNEFRKLVLKEIFSVDDEKMFEITNETSKYRLCSSKIYLKLIQTKYILSEEDKLKRMLTLIENHLIDIKFYLNNGILFETGKLKKCIKKNKIFTKNLHIFVVFTRKISDYTPLQNVCNISTHEMQTILSPFSETTEIGFVQISCFLQYLKNKGNKFDIFISSVASLTNFHPLVVSLLKLSSKNEIDKIDLMTITSCLHELFSLYLPHKENYYFQNNDTNNNNGPKRKHRKRSYAIENYEIYGDKNVFDFTLKISTYFLLLYENNFEFDDNADNETGKDNDFEINTAFLYSSTANFKSTYLKKSMNKGAASRGNSSTKEKLVLINDEKDLNLVNLIKFSPPENFSFLDNVFNLISCFKPLTPLDYFSENSLNTFIIKLPPSLAVISKATSNDFLFDVHIPYLGTTSSFVKEIINFQYRNNVINKIPMIYSFEDVKEIVILCLNTSYSMFTPVSNNDPKIKMSEISKVEMGIQLIDSFCSKIKSYNVLCDFLVVFYGKSINIIDDFSNLKSILYSTSKENRKVDISNLYETIDFSINKLQDMGNKFPNARKRIILITDSDEQTNDGKDNQNQINFDVKLKEHGIIVDSIVLDENCADAFALSKVSNGVCFNGKELLANDPNSLIEFCETESFVDISCRILSKKDKYNIYYNVGKENNNNNSNNNNSNNNNNNSNNNSNNSNNNNDDDDDVIASNNKSFVEIRDAFIKKVNDFDFDDGLTNKVLNIGFSTEEKIQDISEVSFKFQPYLIPNEDNNNDIKSNKNFSKKYKAMTSTTMSTTMTTSKIASKTASKTATKTLNYFSSDNVIENRNKRILQEIKNINSSHRDDIKAMPLVGKSDIWRVFIRPSGTSVYSKKWWNLLVTFPIVYPISPPEIRFVSTPYHINVSVDGKVCLEQSRYTASSSVIEFLEDIMNTLEVPDEMAPLHIDALEIFRGDRNEYERRAAESVKDNAKDGYEEWARDCS